MKLFSLNDAVSFDGENIVINDLAKNHKYEKENEFLVVKGGTDKRQYKAFYNKDGKFSFVRVTTEQKSKAMLCWRQEYKDVCVEKIDKEGNRIIVHSIYLTTDTVEDKLIRKSFLSEINEQGLCEIMFELNSNGKWCSKGQISPKHRKYWLRLDLK